MRHFGSYCSVARPSHNATAAILVSEEGPRSPAKRAVSLRTTGPTELRTTQVSEMPDLL